MRSVILNKRDITTCGGIVIVYGPEKTDDSGGQVGRRHRGILGSLLPTCVIGSCRYLSYLKRRFVRGTLFLFGGR